MTEDTNSGSSDKKNSSKNEKGTHVRKRQFLKAAGLAATGTIAGCTGGGDGDGSGDGDGDNSGDGGDTEGTTTGGSDNPDTFTNEAGVEVGKTWDKVQELAKEEGSVSFYATLDREAVERLTEKFEKDHPEVDVVHITGTSSDLANRFTSEYQADQKGADLFVEGDRTARLWDNGMAMELSSDYLPSFGEAPDDLKDSENGFWLPLRLVLGNIHYNTDMVSEDEVTSWMDPVTDEKWSDQNLGWDPTPDLMLMWGLLDMEGREFFENLHDQGPRFVDSHTDLARLCGAGEYPICFTYTHKMGRFGNDLPIDYFPLDPTPAVVNPVMMSNKARNPNAALVWFNWITSLKGQNILGEGEYIPYHPDAEYKGWPELYPNPNYDLKRIVPTPDKAEEAQEVWNDTMGDLTGA